MADSVQLELVTPEKLHASLEATLVEVPGGEGDFGVLPGHAPMISTIRPGVVMVHGVGGALQKFFVMGGVSEVTTERCTVLAEHLEDVSHMSPDQALIRLANAKRAAEQAVGSDQKADADRALEAATALAETLR